MRELLGPSGRHRLAAAVLRGALLSAGVATIYVALLVPALALRDSATTNAWLSLPATVVVALLFEPARAACRRVANRVVYRGRATPEDLLARVTSDVASLGSADAPQRLAEVIERGMPASSATVWLRVGDGLQPRRAAGREASRRAGVVVPSEASDDELARALDADRAAAITHRGELVGALSLADSSRHVPMAAEERLLRDVAAAAGPLLHNAGLATELAANVDAVNAQAAELWASRRRIAAAQDAERRAVERDIHDGAQQHLVALSLRLDLARSAVAQGPERAAETVGELRAMLAEGSSTLIDLSRGVYPPALSQEGLGAALRAHVQRLALPVAVDGNPGRFPSDVEAAVYFCCVEAVQNVTKHAPGAHVVVRLSASDGGLDFEVTDDGPGFASSGPDGGTGLRGIADRLAAAGGVLSVRSTPGRGTTVAGRVPADRVQMGTPP